MGMKEKLSEYQKNNLEKISLEEKGITKIDSTGDALRFYKSVCKELGISTCSSEILINSRIQDSIIYANDQNYSVD